MNLRLILLFTILYPVAGYTQTEANSFSSIAEELIVTLRKREENYRGNESETYQTYY